MDRRTFVNVVASTCLLEPLAVRAQQPDKVWRIGYLANGARPPDGAPPKPLRDELAALGFVDGKNIAFEGRWSQGRRDQLRNLAADLLSRNIDLVIALGSLPGEAVKQLTSTTPIVVLNAGDMVETGLVTSLARPGGNVTGINDPAATLSAKRLEILKEVVPSAKRIAVLWNAASNAMTLRYKEVERAAHAMGMTVDPLGVREPDDFEFAFSAMTQARPDALMMLTDALTNLNRQRVLDYVSARQIPAMYEFGDLVRAGGLISYGSDLNETFRMAAHYVAKVLKGAKPGDLPVEQPNRYFLVVNVKTAKTLGLVVPRSLLLRADEVIQ